MPTGVGRSGRYKFDRKELRPHPRRGAALSAWTATWRCAATSTTPRREGRLDGADPDSVSDHALNRGAEQCGTLGSGNHFLEVQVVDHVFDEEVARRLRPGKGHGVRDDPQRLARPGLSGLRRRPGGAAQRPEEVRHRAARPPARLRPGRTARRARSTSPPCVRPPTSPGATASS